jgi:replication initiator protein
VSVKSELHLCIVRVLSLAMGEVHQLILREGLEEARNKAETRGERLAIEAAGAILAEEVSRLGIIHAGFAMTSLPHKRIEEPLWRRQGYRTTLLVESGRTGEGGWIGVPYGSVARLILLYLQTEAIRSNDPEVELGRSMHAWLSRMGISAGGKNYKLVGEQARRISACRLTFLTEVPGAELRQNGAFVQNAITLTALADDRQRALWQDRVRLDDGFWRSLKEHPVPVREEAVQAIGARSLALDVYVWLAYRLHALTKPTQVTWAAVHAQFGAGFKALRQLKPTFREALALALAVYPEARVNVETAGIVLHPSLPAVPRSEARQLGLA